MAQVPRLFDAIYYQRDNYPREDALASKINGKWVKLSTDKVIELANQTSGGLLERGYQSGDKVGIVSYNRPEWGIVDIAMQQLGIISVPMYPNSTADDYEFIITDAAVKSVFVGDEDILQKIKKATNKISKNVEVYTFDHISGDKHWSELQTQHPDLEKIEEYKSKVKVEDLATIIYTSGTTGTPKGVMLSHSNIMSNADAVDEAFSLESPTYRTLSFLPLCHIFERTALYTYFSVGVSIYYAESMDTIAENLKEVKPHLFATVPRLLEKVYDKILTKGYELTSIKKTLFFWALRLGERHIPNEKQGLWHNIQLAIANKLIFSKWREALGNNIKFIASGAAALQPRLTQVFWAAKIPILEAYGLTETSPGVTFTKRGKENLRLGCVGQLLKDINVKIADDGEILVKGPNVMMGYYKRKDLTQLAINKDGWFHTGDIGEWQEGKYLKITDRKKEMFKTSGGKYIAPQVIENKLKESMLIEQVMVVGEQQKFPAALIVPSFDSLREWCKIKQIPYTTNSDTLKLPAVIKKFDKEVKKLNKSFAQYQKIKKISLLPQEWSIETSELTPTLKLKRKVITEKYQSQIDQLYQD